MAFSSSRNRFFAFPVILCQARKPSSSTGKYGVTSTFSGIDVAAVTSYREEVVASKWKGLQGLIKARGITTIEGAGRLVSPTSVQVGDQTIIDGGGPDGVTKIAKAGAGGLSRLHTGYLFHYALGAR